MRRYSILVLAVAALAVALPAQNPCSASALTTPVQAGDTSLSAITGTGCADPWAPPGGNCVSGFAAGDCNWYGDNTSKEDWYHWTAPDCGTLELSTDNAATSLDTSLAVWEGASCGSATFVACNGDAPLSLQSFLSIPVAAGQTYWIKVNGWSSTDNGPYELHSTFTPVACPTPFTLTFSGGAGVLHVDLTNGPPGVDYFTVASFHPANFDPATAGLGWAYGLHVTFNDLVTQHHYAAPPFRGVLDGNGEATFTLNYTAAFFGLQVAALSMVDGTGMVYDWTAIDIFTF